MPVMNGTDASRHILKAMFEAQQPNSENDLTTIVALTSFTTAKVKKECLELGMKKVITKPLTLQNLNEVMTNYFLA